jgi:selT/selW/selH-like putative selenoprotein
LLRDRYASIDVELIQGSGGVFEVRRDGELVFSKDRIGRFPNDDEIFAELGD